MEVQVKLNTKMSHIKPHLYKWLHEAWQYVLIQPDLIVKRWIHVGLIRAFILDFQLEAMEKNATTPLFKPTPAELKNINLVAVLDVNLAMDSDSDIEKDFNIDTTMDSDDDYDIEDSIDQVMQESISNIIELYKNVTQNY
jgi:hypothetical protein